MKKTIRSGTGRRAGRRAGVATAALLAVSSLVVAGPAQASSTCTKNEKSLPTPGYNTDLTVWVCATDGTYLHHGAYLVVSWTDGGDSATDGDRKFDGLVMHLRVERYDADYVRDSWSLAGLVNRNESGTWSSPIIEATSTLRGGWTGDGYVKYDIDRDGEGWQLAWSLHGSPMQY
jgi:hypothetical protein